MNIVVTFQMLLFFLNQFNILLILKFWNGDNFLYTPQPLYNTITEIQRKNSVSKTVLYPNKNV